LIATSLFVVVVIIKHSVILSRTVTASPVDAGLFSSVTYRPWKWLFVEHFDAGGSTCAARDLLPNAQFSSLADDEFRTFSRAFIYRPQVVDQNGYDP
jgi:hypothetical protein